MGEIIEVNGRDGIIGWIIEVNGLYTGIAISAWVDASRKTYGSRFHTLEFNILIVVSESVGARVASVNFLKTTPIAVPFVGGREPGLVQYVLEPLIC